MQLSLRQNITMKSSKTMTNMNNNMKLTVILKDSLRGALLWKSKTLNVDFHKISELESKQRQRISVPTSPVDLQLKHVNTSKKQYSAYQEKLGYPICAKE